MEGGLSTTEKYLLAQILVCGNVQKDEIRQANGFSGSVQHDTLASLRQKGYLQRTMYEISPYDYEWKE